MSSSSDNVAVATSEKSETKKKEEEEDDIPKVVIQHKILSISECFIYRIPPMRSSGGHRAEDWNLASPLASCSLDMLQKDDTLLINLLGDQPMKDGPKGATEKFLFAQSVIELHKFNADTAKYQDLPMHHWAEPVVDSSRYFVLRIFNEKTNREAHIGLGFRERNDAVNFKMGMQDYERSIQREQMIEEMHSHQDHVHYHSSDPNNDDLDAKDDYDGNNGTNNDSDGSAMMSKLSLKEGEKIHINFKTSGSSSRRRSNSGSGKSGGGGGGGLFLLKKPPAPGDVSSSSTTSTLSSSSSSSSSNEESNTTSVKETNDQNDVNVNADDDDDDDDEDEWGDFQ